MADTSPPPRSILIIRSDERGGVLITCDCGPGTHLILELKGDSGSTEFATTCDRCHAVNWFMVMTSYDCLPNGTHAKTGG